MYMPNDYPSSGNTHLENLVYLSTQVGPKGRTSEYNDKLVRLLQASKPKRQSGKRKPKAVKLNSTSLGATVKQTELQLDELVLKALVDTGSTHCLLSVESFHKLTHYCPSNFFLNFLIIFGGEVSLGGKPTGLKAFLI